MTFNDLYKYILENYSEKENFATQGIVFLKSGEKDLGCCIGIEHKKNIELSENLVERIKNIPNLKFYAEGVAAQDPSAEPGMVKAMNDYFKEYKIQPKSWDEITEQQNKGTANPKYNSNYIFMQHRANDIIDRYPYTKGTMLDALAKPNISFPKNSPMKYDERLNWITKHVKNAGFYDKLNQPYNRNKLLSVMDEMEDSVYPKSERFPEGQQFPDTSTYFGNLMHKLEEERNQTIYDLMKQGGCSFAGSGHLIELKQQFSELEIIGEENIK